MKTGMPICTVEVEDQDEIEEKEVRSLGNEKDGRKLGRGVVEASGHRQSGNERTLPMTFTRGWPAH
jgi:hypothetical protein